MCSRAGPSTFKIHGTVRNLTTQQRNKYTDKIQGSISTNGRLLIIILYFLKLLDFGFLCFRRLWGFIVQNRVLVVR